MENENTDRVERPSTVTYPVASFTLKRSHIAWIAKRAAQKGLSKSAYMREALDSLMKEGGKEAA